MKLFDWLLTVLSLLGLMALAGWSYLQFPGLAKTQETELTQVASQALQAGGFDWAFVRVDGQTATLTGTPPSPAARADATDAVLTSSGLGGMVFGGVTAVDDQMDNVALVSPFIWRATLTPEGKVVLAGHAPSENTQSEFRAFADGFALQGVEDRVTVAAGVPGGDWHGAALKGLTALSELDAGTAVLEDRTLFVSGIAMESARRARISAQVADLGEPFIGKPNIDGPSHWAARHEDGVLRLDGRVSNEAEKAEIFAIAQQHFSGDISDEMIVDGPVYNQWMDGVRVGLPHFSRFQTGDMLFDPEGEGFVFEGEAPGSVLTYLREDMSALDGPFEVVFTARDAAVDVAEIADIDFTVDPRIACESAFSTVLAANSVVFASGAADIDRLSGETLDKIMAVAGQCGPDLSFELAGHTDDQGERAFNIFLSETRAQAVANYMTSRGFADDRLSVVGYGPDQPIADNGTPDGRAANRRLEFKVLDRSNQ